MAESTNPKRNRAERKKNKQKNDDDDNDVFIEQSKDEQVFFAFVVLLRSFNSPNIYVAFLDRFSKFRIFFHLVFLQKISETKDFIETMSSNPTRPTATSSASATSSNVSTTKKPSTTNAPRKLSSGSEISELCTFNFVKKKRNESNFFSFFS